MKTFWTNRIIGNPFNIILLSCICACCGGDCEEAERYGPVLSPPVLCVYNSKRRSCEQQRGLEDPTLRRCKARNMLTIWVKAIRTRRGVWGIRCPCGLNLGSCVEISLSLSGRFQRVMEGRVEPVLSQGKTCIASGAHREQNQRDDEASRRRQSCSKVRCYVITARGNVYKYPYVFFYNLVQRRLPCLLN